jgi:hypothetical protein
MAVKRRLKLFSSARLDIPHLRSTESGVASDFDSALRGLVTGLNQPYVIRGFDLVIPNAAIPATSLEIKVSDSAVLHATAAEAGTILSVAAGTVNEILSPTNTKVFGAFQNGVANYVSLAYRRRTDPTTVDQVAGWSESQKIEYQRSVPTGDILEYQFVISTSGFSTNLPLYIVGTTSTGAVQYATKAAPNLFRLGRGGAVPDPYYTFNYHNQNNNSQSPSQPRREWINNSPSLTPNPVTVSPGDPTSAFQYGDFNIANMKEWMDAIMSRFKELTGSTYWYLDSALSAGSPNLFDTWYDSLGSVMTGSGSISYNLVLEAAQPTFGEFQSFFTDSEILAGDSYVVGQTSGNRANISAFNANQLIINSMLRQNFIANETLYNRRLYRPDLVKFDLYNTADALAANKIGVLRRKANGSGTPQSISSWSYTQIGSLSAADCTANFGSAHGFNVGDYAFFSGLACTTNQPSGVYMIKEVPTSTSCVFSVSYLPTGAATVSSATAALDTATHHPYLPTFVVQSWSYVGTAIKVQALGHNFLTGDKITIGGLACTTNAPNGRFTVTVNPDNSINFTATAPTGTATVSSAFVQANTAAFQLTVSGTNPNNYDVIDVVATAASDTDFNYVIGAISLPTIPVGTGAITLDGVVAVSSVLDPTIVSSITWNGTAIVVNTATPHGYASIAGPTDFTIYGNQSLSAYITTYSGVSIVNISSNVFQITGGNVANHGTYTNGGSDLTYARYPNNPYAGPIQWDSDMIIKGIIGDKYMRIPQTATATGTQLANKFNINGLTGTAYLQDGEVAYIIMERNKLLANGASYSTAGGSAQVTGSTSPTYVGGTRLRVGDFVKWEDESEASWLRVSNQGYPSLNEGDQLPSLATNFYLVTDNGQPPTSSQRPAKTGRMVYTRGTYQEVIVSKHWQVTQSADIYWIAVRRDNGALKSKVYLKALELELGEVRQINDNAPSNLLTYTGAGSEAAINPNYSVIDQTGAYQESQVLAVGSNAADKDNRTRQVTFDSAPELDFQAGDKIVKTVGLTHYSYLIKHVITSRTVIMADDISTLAAGDTVTYYRVNHNINDSDNLTLAIRKEDRDLAKVNTALTRPIYDETVYLQKMNVTGSGFIKSGSYIYKGTQDQPTALAWVLHGTSNQTETIEGFGISMPGSKFGASSILVHILSGTFSHGDSVYQNGASTYTINNVGNPAFPSPAILAASNVEIVLPPNRRTQVVGSSYVVWPTNCAYKASLDDNLCGEELLVIANDSIRQANLDYSETYGGPKGKIEISRNLPINTRLRFRILPAYGSANVSSSSSTSLQLAYDGGNIVSILSGRPIDVRVSDRTTGIALDGTLSIDAVYSGNVVGGIMPKTDRSFDIGTEALKVNQIWTAIQNIKTHTTHPSSGNTKFTAVGTSTNNSAYIIPSSNITLAQGEAMQVVVTGVARRSEGVATPTTQGSASFRIEGCFYRETAGSTQAAGSPYNLVSGAYGDGISYALTFGTVGNDVVAVAFGESAAIEWAISVEYQKVRLPS